CVLDAAANGRACRRALEVDALSEDLVLIASELAVPLDVLDAHNNAVFSHDMPPREGPLDDERLERSERLARLPAALLPLHRVSLPFGTCERYCTTLTNSCAARSSGNRSFSSCLSGSRSSVDAPDAA